MPDRRGLARRDLNLPLLQSADPSRAVVWSGGRAISAAEFLSHVNALARQLPPERYLVNLCEQRYYFIVAFCAALARGQTNLLPSSRVADVVDEVIATNAGSYRCDDAFVKRALESAGESAASLQDRRYMHAQPTPSTQSSQGAQSADSARPAQGAPSAYRAPPAHGASPDAPAASLVNFHGLPNPTIPADHIAAIAFTSGSTGKPKAHIKRWGSFLQSTPMNAGAIRSVLKSKYGDARPYIVATVPPQHMYGMETSVLLPLAADMAIHEARPLFPADVAAALNEIPAPRVLVTTPVHMRALLASGQKFPDIAVVVSATAPLDASLAISIEREWRTVMLEMFGSTETCVIAVRHTAREEAWSLYRGVSLRSLEDSAEASSPWFDAPTLLQDVVEVLDERRFLIRGRNVDMIEVAGKRASLADLTRRLLSVPGVEDAVIFQPDAAGASGVRRVAALVVAPGLTAESIVEQLGRSVDPVFIPRPLMLVPVLPRNELGKMPRDRLLAALKTGGMEEAR